MSGSDPTLDPTLATAALLGGLLALHLVLQWIGFPVAGRRRWYLVYFGVQGLLVQGLVVVWEGDRLAIASILSYALVGEAIVVLRRPSQVGEVAAGCLALFVLGQWVSDDASKRNLFDWSFYLMLVVPLVPLGLGYALSQARERDRFLLHELEFAHAQVQASAAHVEELTLMTERQRMARELHDTLAQGLAGVIMQLEVAKSHLAPQRTNRAQEVVVQAMARARSTLADARQAIDGLRTFAAGPDGLPEAAIREIDRFTAATGIPCVADLAALAQTPAPLCEHVLRTITEGLANVARHAQARHVWVRAESDQEEVRIEVRDDGIGFEPAVETRRGGHYGLLGLRERARLGGGSLEVSSATGVGTTLRLRLPRTN
jgi:NarL family two-component system sensor histidine kinase YdfH